MKQNINKEDLDMLTEKGKERLVSYCKQNNLLIGKHEYHSSDEGIWCYSCAEVIDDEEKTEIPFLSIGQLIEFLDKKENGKYGSYIDENDFEHCIAANSNTSLGWDGELCDGLWLKVVEILNKEV